MCAAERLGVTLANVGPAPNFYPEKDNVLPSKNRATYTTEISLDDLLPPKQFLGGESPPMVSSDVDYHHYMGGLSKYKH